MSDEVKKAEAKEAPECPQKLFESAYHNGNGFQLHKGEYLVLAFLWTYEGKDINTAITDAAATKLFEPLKSTARVDSWLTRTYLEIHWRDYDRIPEILQFALDAGFSLTLQSKMDTYYAAGDRFNPLRMEERFIQRFRDTLKQFHQRPGHNDPDPWRIAFSCVSSAWILLAKWNWFSSTGQAFCQELRAHFPDKVRDEDVDDPKYNYFKFPGVDEAARKYQLLQYGKWWWGKEKREEEKAPEVLPLPAPTPPPPPPPPPLPLCVICEEQPANTLVMPCGHIVVCSACSELLQKTPDRDVCVQCRKKIDVVMQDS